MNRFRLLHWAELPEEFRQLRFRRAMAAMSARPVDQHRLSRECGIDRKEMLAFLSALLSAGAIATHPPLRLDYMSRMKRLRRDRPAGVGSAFFAWLRQWLMADAPLAPGARNG